MGFEVLEAHQTDELSACRLSLILGVYSADNKIERYLRVARAILNVENAFFSFHSEPYIWIATEASDFNAALMMDKTNLSHHFEHNSMVTRIHKNYDKFTQQVQNFGIEHQRLLCYDFKLENDESIAHIYFYDDENKDFTVKQQALLVELTSGLVTILQRKSESQDYFELYEQERALNFSKTKFFQVIAHDLRAPFHGLIGFSDVLANERHTLDEEGVQNIAEYLYDTLQSTYSLLENLLNWAMAEGGRFVYHPINFKLKEVTKIIYDVLNPLAINKDIELIINVADDLSVFADMNMLTSIIQNLVSNALKFTQIDGSGRVSISAQKLDQNIEIKIHDTGLGMTKFQIDHVFEPEIKASNKGTIGEQGTGLGLVLCKRFVDLNHGQISVSSQKGIGTTFTIMLPATKAGCEQMVLPQTEVSKIKVS